MSAAALANAAVRRTSQAYFQQVSACTALACGCAYHNRDYPHVAGCNFLGEVLLGSESGDALKLVDEFYEQRGLTCYRWVPAADQDPEAVGALLAPAGFRRREYLTYLASTPGPAADVGQLRVLSARAMRRAYTQVVARRSAEHGPAAAELTAVQLERLDDPSYEGLVGFRGGQPVGVIGLLQVGRIGRLCDLYVPPQWRRSGVATGLVRYALRTAWRWALEPICAQVAAENVAGRRLLEGLGFERGTPIVTFARTAGPSGPF